MISSLKSGQIYKDVVYGVEFEVLKVCKSFILVSDFGSAEKRLYSQTDFSKDKNRFQRVK